MPGPVAQDSNVRQLRGNPGKRKSPNTPQPAKGIPAAPTWLTAEAKAEWKRVTPELERLGMLAFLDRAVLTIYCDSWSQFVAATKTLRKEEAVVDDKAHTGVKKHPAWMIRRQAAAEVMAAADKMGLSKSARDRMKAPEADVRGVEDLDD